MVQLDDLIDKSYDSDLPGLRWLPWVGKGFGKDTAMKKLLIIGESDYAKATETETIEAIQKKHEENREQTRECVWECQFLNDWRNRTLDNIPRLFVGSNNGSKSLFWQDVAYYNFVQRTMLYTNPPERPNWNDFVSGWDMFLNVVRVTIPDLCVFLGSEARHSFWPSMTQKDVKFSPIQRTQRIGRWWGYKAEISVGQKNIPMIFVKHPGKFFSPARWHDYLLKEFPADIEAIKKKYRDSLLQSSPTAGSRIPPGAG